MHVYDIFRWIVALVLGLFGWLVIFVNFKVIYVRLRRREYHSWVPLVGGFFACMGMILCPLRQVQRFALVPLGVDTVLCILVLAIGFLTLCFARKRRDDA